MGTRQKMEIAISATAIFPAILKNGALAVKMIMLAMTRQLMIRFEFQ
jgi:hypothetical protein